jgi:alanyl-tRNA synthetase
MKGSDIRHSFLDFFAQRGHRVHPSAPLVPQSDPTLLFTNAGMVPFKNYFLGAATPPSKRATSVQKSLRVSGKHNDLENVGPSPRHHTFFEMLGNFSFGDYFKADAIELAWELVTREWRLDPAVLYATIYQEDDEAFELWKKIAGLPESRIVRCGKKDNFWAMGETGPCGPCSEIHIDLHADQPLVPWEEGSDSGRYFEFWNLVFMQFDAKPGGELVPLPNPSIDTGAGLERVTAVLQRVPSNYDTDLFQPLLHAAADLAGKRYGEAPGDDLSMRVVADHLRAVGFLLADGVVPGNEGRGYVLRRILRRAVRHGLRLGLEQPFLNRLLPVLASTMAVYPELEATREASTATVLAEEEKFLATVATASRHVQELVEVARAEGRHRLEGGEAFRLYDTFGLPIELVREILEEEGSRWMRTGSAPSWSASASGRAARPRERRGRRRACAPRWPATSCRRRASSATTGSSSKARASCAWRARRRARSSRRGRSTPVKRESWCSTRPCSTPSRAARSATGARWRAPASGSR